MMEARIVAETRHKPWQNLITVVSVMILIGTEVFGVAFAAGWAIAGLFELGDRVGYVLMGLFSILGVMALVSLWRRTVHIDPIS
jgi:hypothetical protein